MDRLELLDLAAASFSAHLESVGDEDWTRPTPCAEWDVGELVDHVIGGNRFTSLILDGATAADAMSAVMASFDPGDDRTLEVRRSLEAQRAAFRHDGALARMCHHVAGDMPGAKVLGFRLADLTLHGWDLARAIGSDETIDDRLVGAVWEDMAPLSEVIAATGRFGDGPSGTVPADAALQVKLLDLAGRRP